MRTAYLSGVLALVSLAPALTADDQSARERKVKVALALTAGDAAAKAKARVTVAPAPAPSPRVVEPKDYATGYKKAEAEKLPLVVYVRCESPARVPGAVVSRVQADEFAGVKAPAVVVGYPSGDRIIVDAVLGCTASEAEVERAVKAAGKKVAEPLPKDTKAAPPPLNWMISTTPAGGCTSCTACACPAGFCPTRCAVQPAGAAYATAAALANCPNGRCPLQR